MMSSDPETKEQALLLRQALAEAGSAGPVVARDSSESDVELVYFRIHDQLYAFVAGQVSAILGAPTLTELPHAPAHLPGVVSHQGRIVAVVDVAVLDGLEPVTNASRILIIEGAGLDAGIRVSEVLELARVPFEAIEPPPASLSQPDHVIAQLRRGDVTCFVMDAARLLDRVRQRVRASGVTR